MCLKTTQHDTLKELINGQLNFECPGCKMQHGVWVDPSLPGPRWAWNGSLTLPTFSPSILVSWNSMTDEGREKIEAFYQQHKRYATREEIPCDKKNICHSYVTNGMIEFLDDCTHELAGETVPLPVLEEYDDEDEANEV
jgi:hypothetical protein